jgi:transposase
MFIFCDDTGPWTATYISLLLSCQLHGLDGEQYLRDLMRVVPHWPRNRMLELSPAYWAETRAKLTEVELAMPLGR